MWIGGNKMVSIKKIIINNWIRSKEKGLEHVREYEYSPQLLMGLQGRCLSKGYHIMLIERDSILYFNIDNKRFTQR